MQRTSIPFLLALGFAAVSLPAYAQNERRIKTKVFRDAAYYEPLLAEPTPARTCC